MRLESLSLHFIFTFPVVPNKRCSPVHVADSISSMSIFVLVREIDGLSDSFYAVA